MDNLEKNKEYIVTVEAYNSQGHGVARIDGRAVFVPGALQGEVWQIKILKVTSAAVYAKGIELLKQAETRCTPSCRFFARCGGCDTWHMAYEEELRFKLNKVNDALSHIGHQSVSAERIIGSDNPQRYRNKGIFNVCNVSGQVRYGFYRERTHNLVPIDRCLIQMPLGEKVSRTVTDFMNRHNIKAYDEETGSGTVRHIFCRSSVTTHDAVACIISARGFGSLTDDLINRLIYEVPELTGIVLCINRERYNTVLSGDFYTLYGRPEITDHIGRNMFTVSPQAFFQINPPQAEKLYSVAVEYASRGLTTSALELYCGAGTISLA